MKKYWILCASVLSILTIQSCGETPEERAEDREEIAEDLREGAHEVKDDVVEGATVMKNDVKEGINKMGNKIDSTWDARTKKND